jgi:hypothetical protein
MLGIKKSGSMNAASVNQRNYRDISNEDRE